VYLNKLTLIKVINGLNLSDFSLATNLFNRRYVTVTVNIREAISRTCTDK